MALNPSLPLAPRFPLSTDVPADSQHNSPSQVATARTGHANAWAQDILGPTKIASQQQMGKNSTDDLAHNL